METIIGLLVILLPTIFKLIGKKLEQAGNPEQAKQLRELAEGMLADEEERVVPVVEQPKPASCQVIERVEVPQPPQPQKQQNAQKPKTNQPVHKPVAVTVEKDNSKKEKIDPKKMVIYSEIMKRKF